MKKFHLRHSNGKTKIIIGESINNLTNYIDADRTIIITDSNVLKYYGNRFPGTKIIVINAGEKSKTLKTINFIIEKLISYEADRSSFLLAIGGGVVCDLCAFSASIFHRGINFGFAPTTLLAQADASIGGKNGVNFDSFKNLVGTIRQPEFVISDFSVLGTLPKMEFNNGIAEIIKTSLIADEKLFSELENICLNTANNKQLEDIVFRTAKIKAEIVQIDEFEQNQRRILNFGHTFAHALESVYKIPHGKAVSIGMMKALDISAAKLGLNPEVNERVKKMLMKNNLPFDYKMDRNKIMDAIYKDKKRDSTLINFVLLKQIGKPLIEKMSFNELSSFI